MYIDTLIDKESIRRNKTIMKSALSASLPMKGKDQPMRPDIVVVVALAHLLVIGVLLHDVPLVTPAQVLKASWLGGSGSGMIGSGSSEALTKKAAIRDVRKGWVKHSSQARKSVRRMADANEARHKSSSLLTMQRANAGIGDTAANGGQNGEHAGAAVSQSSIHGGSAKGGGSIDGSHGSGAGYLFNPKPDYPPQSRDLGEKGKVFLRVLVSPQGSPLTIEIYRSSGYPRLDHAARTGVERWKFKPALQGNVPVSAWVVIPVNFTLES